VRKTLYVKPFLDQFEKGEKNSEKGGKSSDGNWVQSSCPRRWRAWQDQDRANDKGSTCKSVGEADAASRGVPDARSGPKPLDVHAAVGLAQRWPSHSSGDAATWQR
jgi:hypothetical protein